MTRRFPPTCLPVLWLFIVLAGLEAVAQHSDLSLVRDNSVRDELKLERNQVHALDALKAAHLKEWSAWYQEHYLSIPREQRRKKAHDKMLAFQVSLAQKYHRELKDVLRPSQLARLREIAIQYGSASLSLMIRRNPEIVASLEITNDQKRRMAVVKNQAELLEAYQLNGEERAKAIREWGEKRNKQFLDILTQEQRAKLEELKGKPFDFSSLNSASRKD